LSVAAFSPPESPVGLSDDSPDSPLASLPDLAAGFAPPPLKSVAYQPLPLSWNPAADSSLLNVSLPQDGQTVSFGSECFWRNSSWKPHSEHLYS